jgi:hypothetical protein
VLHLSELSDHCFFKKEKEKEKARLATTLMRYMTLESSKLFKLALTWVATTQSDAIE